MPIRTPRLLLIPGSRATLEAELRGPGALAAALGVAVHPSWPLSRGPPTDDGTVEIGYSVIPTYQRRGLATEAVEGMLQRAFASPEVRRVIAETLPELAPSIRVLEKSGFSLIGEGSEPGVVRYERRRAS